MNSRCNDIYVYKNLINSKDIDFGLVRVWEKKVRKIIEYKCINKSITNLNYSIFCSIKF